MSDTYSLKNVKGSFFSKIDKRDAGRPPVGCSKRHTPVYPLGGGPVMWVPIEDLTEATPPNVVQEGFASLDDGVLRACMCNPSDKWNGWACPSFTKEVMDDILDSYNDNDKMKCIHEEVVNGDLVKYYLWDKDEEYEDKRDADIVIFINQKTGLHYVDGWCWHFYTAEEAEIERQRQLEVCP